MPDSTKALHPSGGLGITFTESDHRYIDDDGAEYVSTTTLIHSHFPQFNEDEAAARCAAREGRSAAGIKREWEGNRDRASMLGTRAHQNCERQFLGQYDRLNTPLDDEERNRFAACWDKVGEIAARAKVTPEMLIFSPRFKVAGSIDVFGKIAPKRYLLGDWKFTKTISRDGFGKHGLTMATCDLPDANFYRYSLQLNIYEMICRVEGYIEADAAVEKQILHYNGDGFDEIAVPDFTTRATLMLAWNVTNDGLDHRPF